MTIALHLLTAAVIISSILRISSSISTKTIADASEILTNSGFTSMALMVEFVSPQTQIPNSPAVTIFSPPDTAFERSGQPSLSTFELHLVPLALTFGRLRALPTGARITTMSGKSLIATSSNQVVSVNGVGINQPPLFNDGFLVIYGVDDFFDPNFVFATSNSNSTARCVVPGTQKPVQPLADFSFSEASEVLRSRGYAVMASFLDMQLMLGFNDQTRKLTVLAPVDEVMETLVGNVADYASLFLRHVIPCKLTWMDLVDLGDGVSLRTYLDGFLINLSRTTDRFSESADTMMLNEAEIEAPDLYQNDWLVVHGLNDILMVTDDGEEDAELDLKERQGSKRPGHVGDEL
uniref:FAS1 domain-containing protein n=1 Tax=Kalanchoe fedtschenkoi TaxID=63787 RepID=A0A7N0VAK5_KALFE